MQWEYDAAGAQLDVFGDRCQCGARDRGVRIQTTKLMEVTLRRPHGFVVVLVGVARAFQQQPVTVSAAVAVAVSRGSGGKVEETEVQLAVLSLFPLGAAALARQPMVCRSR